jgi:energy-coupling factor transporter ATP-binding protein EcfA2
MTNTISLRKIYKSIAQLEDTPLPNFVVLTGRNGSGKSHLLSAIQGGHVNSTLVSDLSVDVKLFDSSTIIPNEAGAFDPAQDQTRKSQLFNVLRMIRDNHYQTIRQTAINLGIPSSYCTTISEILSLNVEMLRTILTDPSRADQVHTSLWQHLTLIGSSVGQQFGAQTGDKFIQDVVVPEIQQNRPQTFLLASESEFFVEKKLLWGGLDPFQQAFGRVFATYRNLLHENDRLEKYPPLSDPTKRHRNTQDFLAEYGSPPWDFVNQILDECRLDFRVDHPPLHEIGAYEPKLRKISSDIEMSFQDLSSGEKAPLATSNSPTFGRSNSPRQDGLIIDHL